MHPVLANPRRLGFYLLAWLPFAGLLDGALRSSGMDTDLVAGLALAMALLYAFLGLTPYYLCRLAPLPQAPIRRVLLIHAPAALLTTSVWLAGGGVIVSVAGEMFGRTGQMDLFRQSTGALFTFGVLVFALSVAIHYLAMAFERSRRAERRALELQVVARDAELKVLRAQIDPHFLFNSLHSIAALTTTAPADARRMCVLLGDFLRSSLRLGQRPFIPLAEELALVRGYLAIEQVRLGPRLTVDLSVDEGSGDVEIP
ncbi:MAG TPA: histidine kinase, partial [Vicinamibacterales bacterium]|nr:histidine kinase [Vicinamibacterales bacterium]